MARASDPPGAARPLLRSAGIGLTAGIAAWCSAGALDVTTSGDRIVRIAMLPSLLTAAAFVLAGVVGCLAFTAWWAGRTETRRRASREVLLPLLATGILALPYLPFIADACPAITTLAGPAKYLVWLIAILLAALAAVHDTVGTDVGTERIPARAVGVGVFLVSVVVFSLAAQRLTETPLFPGGDEPHYLVIAQSVWRDGDLRIENNHRRGDTTEYYPVDLEPHYLTRGSDGEIYSVHPVGLPLALAPVYAVGGYRAVVVVLVLVAATVALLSWRLAYAATGCLTAATFAWLACGVSAPFVFNSFTVYPEMPAALMVTSTYLLASTRACASVRGAWRWFLCGWALAALPWLSTKYVFMAGALGVVALARLWWPVATHTSESPSKVTCSIALCAPPLVSLVVWLVFFAVIWGSPSPGAPYGADSGTRVSYLAQGGPGLFIDQEYGLLAVAPALGIGLVGLFAMARSSPTRRVAIEIAAVMIGLLSLVGAFHIWWGGSAAVGRPMIAALPLFTAPLAWQFRQKRRAAATCAAYIALLAVGLACVWVLATVDEGFLLAAQRNGRSPLLLWLSPTGHLSAMAPSFIVDHPAVAIGQGCVWALAFALAGLSVRRLTSNWGVAGAAVFGAGATALVAVAMVVPVAFASWPRQGERLDRRTEVLLLNDFSPALRPIAVRYDPLMLMDPADVPAAFTFVAAATDDRLEAPLPLLFNGRWSLPAGRYRVALAANARGRTMAEGTLKLQLGRLGLPVQEWPVAFDDRGTWSTAFDLPVASNSVGFLATEPLEPVVSAIRLTPVSVTETRGMPARREVLQAGRYGAVGSTWVFFHDDRTSAEQGGFWSQGDAESVFTVASVGRPPSTLRLRAGPVPTTVIVSMFDTTQRVQLAPHQTQDLDIPSAAAGRPWLLRVDTPTMFVPIEIDATQRDRRRLGCWIELIDGSGAP